MTTCIPRVDRLSMDPRVWGVTMSFRLKNAPQVFQRKMDKIFSDYSAFIIVYIDDMLIYSDNEKYNEKHLNIFITLCKEHDIVLSEKKVDTKKKK